MKTPKKIAPQKEPVAQAKAKPEQAASGEAQFENSRPDFIAQRKLREGMAVPPGDENTVQLRSAMASHGQLSGNPIQRAAKQNGLPQQLKSGIEGLSGYSMDDVKVHYNSSKPAQLQAHAYAQGSNIHLAPGQEKHLPHEAWHVVQQKQGRVKATRQLKGKVAINDDSGLEREADVMGAKALRQSSPVHQLKESKLEGETTQLQKISNGAKVGLEIETTLPVRRQELQTDTDLIAAMGQHAIDPAHRDSGTTGKSRSDQLLSRLELKAKEQVYQGNGWRAEADHMTKIERLYEGGVLYSRAGVEIVTDPVSTINEARTIMGEIQGWVTGTLQNARGGAAPLTFNGTDYVIEMPQAAERELLDRDGGIWGNFQVNFGAYLEDVPDLFMQNVGDIYSSYYKLPQEAIIQYLAQDDLWAEIWKECSPLLEAEAIVEGDEPFLRSIMFQTMYEMISHHTMTKKAEGQRNDSEKNFFMILRKTALDMQIMLSDMPSKQKFVLEGVRDKFAAICKEVFDQKLEDPASREIILGKEDYGQSVYDTAFKMMAGEEATIFAARDEVNEPKDLELSNKRHAGVFELRGLQGKLMPQAKWLDIWLHYFDTNLPNPYKKGRDVNIYNGTFNQNFMGRANMLNGIFANRGPSLLPAAPQPVAVPAANPLPAAPQPVAVPPALQAPQPQQANPAPAAANPRLAGRALIKRLQREETDRNHGF